jgi:hypothetical protein
MYKKKKLKKNSFLYSVWELLHNPSSNQYLRCFEFPQQYFHTLTVRILEFIQVLITLKF